MGLENSNSATFLTIGDGKIVRQVPAPTASSKERTNKNGKLVHEEKYDKITGLITGIVVREHKDFGKFWAVTIIDGSDSFQLEFKYSSGYANSFLKTLPNVDLTAPVTLIPKLTVEGDKKKTSLFISQHGQALKWFYTKEHTNGLPELKKVKVKGVDIWDDTDRMEFLEKMMATDIIPKLPKAVAVTAQPVVAAQTADAFADDEYDEPVGAPVKDEKLPF